jgi:integrase
MNHLQHSDPEGFKEYEELQKSWNLLTSKQEKELFLSQHTKQSTAHALIHYKHQNKQYAGIEHAHAESQQYTKKQEENIITWDEVIKVRESLPKDSQDYMMISLYTQDMPPVRCDYTPMRAFLTQEEAVGYAENYIVVNDKEATMHILKYKTAKSHGPIVEPLPPVIKKIVQSYMLVKKDDKTELKQQWLLLDKSKKVMSKASLSGNVIKIFHDATGKNVGITLLRVIHNTAKGEGERPILEKAKTARVMGHSVRTGETYAKKPRSLTQSNEIVMSPKAKPAKTVKMADGTIRRKKETKVGKKITFEVL